jgi:L-ascorbate metabolism protein UlaG (beta-lactamase superfamily)
MHRLLQQIQSSISDPSKIMITYTVTFLSLPLLAQAFFQGRVVTSPKSYAKFLESNTWVFKFGDVQIFSDPVMSQLDFGIPAVYRGNKRFIDEDAELQSAAQTSDLVLISQGFDDHAHRPTLLKLKSMRPDMAYVCPPSAVSILKGCGIGDEMITTLQHGQKYEVAKGKTRVEILATSGALLGPPWQTKENGYIIRPAPGTSVKFPSVYYEPHCMFDETELRRAAPVDYVITPVVAQKLPRFTLVDGGEKALDLAKALGAKCIIPMMNGELEQAGVLSRIIRKEGSVEEFQDVVSKSRAGIKVISEPAGSEILLS